MVDDDLSTCTCLDCTPERWLPQPSYAEMVIKFDGRDIPTIEPDTCDGYVSDGPFSCICDRCQLASEPHHPISPEAMSRSFWWLLRSDPLCVIWYARKLYHWCLS